MSVDDVRFQEQVSELLRRLDAVSADIFGRQSSISDDLQFGGSTPELLAESDLWDRRAKRCQMARYALLGDDMEAV